MNDWLQFLLWVAGVSTAVSLVIGRLIASQKAYTKAFDARHMQAADSLIKVNKELEAEQLQLAKVRAERVTEVTLKLTDVQAQLTALQQLYGNAIMALEQASMREATLRRQIEEQNRIINELRQRITELERLNSVKPSGG